LKYFKYPKIEDSNPAIGNRKKCLLKKFFFIQIEALEIEIETKIGCRKCLERAMFHYAKCRYAECRYAECRYAECCYAECQYAECRYAKCRYAECRGAVFNCYSDQPPPINRKNFNLKSF
jgi:hypothetical protein